MNLKTITLCAALAAVLPQSVAAKVPVPDADADEKTSREEEMYDDGTSQLDEGHWQKALDIFGRLTKTDGPKADAARYWSAYAQQKLGRGTEALKTLAELTGRFPKSPWLKDARALEQEIRQAGGKGAAPPNPDAESDEELKLIALNGLMGSDPERALPILQKFLDAPQPVKLKERALFVLAQSGSPRAQEIVASIARGSSNPALQEKAIHYLGVTHGERSRQLLAEIYAGSSSNAIKRQVLHAFMVAGERDRLLTAAREEKDAGLRGEAAHWLGVMGAKGELYSLYEKEADRDVRERILQGMFISGDVEHVTLLARSEKDLELRGEAIHKLGLMGMKTSDTLLQIYRGEPNKDLKERVIQALFLQGNAKALVELARAEKNRELKGEAVQKLSIMKSKDASDYMLELLEK